MDDELMKPRGGAPSRLSVSEIECMYCNRAISRVQPHRTCPICAAEWESAFGSKWFAQTWHTELEIEHRSVFGSTHGVVESLNPETLSIAELPERGPGKRQKQRQTVYYAVKDILIVAYAARNSAIIAASGVDKNDARLRALQELGTALGPIKVRALLVARGFREDGSGLMSIPSEHVVRKYVEAAREELDNYIPAAEIIEFPQARARKTFENRVAAVA